jgi:hypothetical protein
VGQCYVREDRLRRPFEQARLGAMIQDRAWAWRLLASQNSQSESEHSQPEVGKHSPAQERKVDRHRKLEDDKRASYDVSA